MAKQSGIPLPTRRLPYTPAQVAQMYGVSVNSIYNEIKSGRLRAHHKRGDRKRWYVTEADLAHWAEHGMFGDG